MALSQTARTKILRAMRIFKSLMIFRSVGPSALSKMQLRELQMSGLLTKFKGNSAPIVEAYLKTHEQMAADGNFAPLSMRNGAINFLERMTERYVGKAVDQLSADIQSKVESTIMPFSDTNEGRAIYGTLKDPKNFSKYLGNELNGKVENWENRYKTIVHTELHRAANWGSLDAILHNSNGADPSEITAYKRGNKPGAGACSTCKGMWYEADGVTPKLFKLSELISNGSNIGRKQKDWLPTVDLTHPNCTHILHKLQNGFGFDTDGTPKYINKDHNEIEARSKMMKSELEKGAMQRLAPFNPEKDRPDKNQMEQIDAWQGSAHRTHRREVRTQGGPARDRFLHKLSAKTKTRKASDGGREFLLHRGTRGAELLAPGVNHETHVAHAENSSWTPEHKVAKDFATHDAQTVHNIDSAWIHEKHILTVPKQFGSVLTGSTSKGKNAFSGEHEVIVGPHSSERANHKATAFTEVKSDINERITQRGQQGYAHFQHPTKVLEQRRAKTTKDPK